MTQTQVSVLQLYNHWFTILPGLSSLVFCSIYSRFPLFIVGRPPNRRQRKGKHYKTRCVATGLVSALAKSVMLLCLLTIFVSNAKAEVLVTDYSWRGIAPMGNLEGQPFAAAGSNWEANNAGWNSSLSFDDSGWGTPVPQPDTWFPTNTISPYVVWVNGENTPIYLRRKFDIDGTPTFGILAFGVDDDAQIFINGALAVDDSDRGATYRAGIDVSAFLAPGTNLIAVKAHDTFGGNQVFGFRLDFDYVAVPEPSTWALALAAAASWLLIVRRRRAQSLG